MVSELGTPLAATLHATKEGHEESISLKCVKLLVEVSYLLFIFYYWRCNLLEWLVWLIFEFLIHCSQLPYLQAGADVNCTDPDSPLVIATTHGLTDCIEYLLKAGANANIPNNCVSNPPPPPPPPNNYHHHIWILPACWSLWFLQFCCSSVFLPVNIYSLTVGSVCTVLLVIDFI